MIELLRKIFRPILPRSLYHLVATVTDAIVATRKIGFSEYIRLKNCYENPSAFTEDLIEFDIPNLIHPFYVRSNTKDASILMSSVIRGEYAVYLPEEPVELIIDAGAYIGDTSALYASKFQDAQIFALEPSSDSFAIASKNLAPYGDRVKLLQKGLWSKESRIKIKGSSTGASVVEVDDDLEYDCITTTVTSILRESGKKFIDIFKCDIEGAELQVFSSNFDEWLSCTRCIFIEIHSPEALNCVLNSTSKYGFTHTTYRSIHLFHRVLDN